MLVWTTLLFRHSFSCPDRYAYNFFSDSVSSIIEQDLGSLTLTQGLQDRVLQER